MLRLLPILFLAVLATNCKVSKNPKDVIVGKIVAEQSTTKGGKPIEGVRTFYFEFGEEKIFIKFSECKPEIVTELKTMVDRDAVLRIERKTGNWDSDDPNVQSRIGEYCVVLSIIKR